MFQALRISRGKRHWPGGCPPPVTVNQDPDWRFAKLRNRLNGGKSGGEMPLELSIAVPAGCLQSLATVVNHLEPPLQGNRRRNFLARARDLDSSRELVGGSRGSGWTLFGNAFPGWRTLDRAMPVGMIFKSCW